MIRVRITRRNTGIEEMVIQGHADAADRGEDLVCAGVSSIVFGLCNALDEMKAQAEINVGKKVVIRTDSDDALTQTVLNTGYYQLKTIGDQYPDNMKITEV